MILSTNPTLDIVLANDPYYNVTLSEFTPRNSTSSLCQADRQQAGRRRRSCLDFWSVVKLREHFPKARDFLQGTDRESTSFGLVAHKTYTKTTRIASSNFPPANGIQPRRRRTLNATCASVKSVFCPFTSQLPSKSYRDREREREGSPFCIQKEGNPYYRHKRLLAVLLLIIKRSRLLPSHRDSGTFVSCKAELARGRLVRWWLMPWFVVRIKSWPVIRIIMRSTIPIAISNSLIVIIITAT